MTTLVLHPRSADGDQYLDYDETYNLCEAMLRASNPGMTPTGEEVVDLVRQLIGSKKSAKANQEDLRDRLLDVLIEVRFGTISRAKTGICTK